MSKSVYIVDDNASALQHNIVTFKQSGIDVAGYSTDPLEALRELLAFTDDKRPDIVCLDIIMPAMDGIELYRKLTAAKSGWRIIFVTALAMEHKFVGHFAKTIGADKFIPKPLSVDNLQQALAAPATAPEATSVAADSASGGAPKSSEAPPPTPPATPAPQRSETPSSQQPSSSTGASGQGDHIAPFGRDPKL